MWTNTAWDFLILGAGYVLALSLFRRLGGFSGAGLAISRWGRSSSERRAPKLAALRRTAAAKNGRDGDAVEQMIEPLRDAR